MLSIQPIKSSKYYEKGEFKNKDNYYNENETATTFFYGGLADRLLLKNETVQKDALTRFLSGHHPDSNEFLFKTKNERKYTDEKMKGKATFDTMKYGIDFTFNAPKDFSILAELDKNSFGEDEETYDQIMDKAIKRAIDKIEENTVYRTRKSKTGYANDSKIIAFVYKHETSREVDSNRPDLHRHAHVVIPDKIQNENGEWYTYFMQPHYDNIRLFGAVFRAELANGLRRKGFEIEPTKGETVVENGQKFTPDSFKIKGITDEQREFFSGRSNKMKSIVGKDATALDKQNAILETREWKEGDYDRMELKNIWQKEAESLGLNQKFIDGIKTNKNNLSTSKYIKTEEYLLKYCMQKGRILEKNLLTKLYENEQYTGINADNQFQQLISSKKIYKETQTYVKKVKVKRKIVSKFEAKNYEYKTKLNIKSANSIQKKCETAINTLLSKNLIKLDFIKDRFSLSLNDYLSNYVKESKNFEQSKKTKSTPIIAGQSSLLIQYGMLQSMQLNPDIDAEEKGRILVELIKLEFLIQKEREDELNKDNKFNM